MNRFVVTLLAAAAPVLAGATTCHVVSGTALAFGDYEYAAAAPADSLTLLGVRCERDGGEQHVTVTVRVDAGAHPDAAGGRRLLHTGGSGDTLAYGLYHDPARSSPWGSSQVDVATASLWIQNRSSAVALFLLYGRIPPRQDVAAGSYADRVQIRILY